MELFSLRLSNKKKNGNSQHNNSHPVWMNQNYTIFYVNWQENIFSGVPQNFSSLCMTWDEKGWKLLTECISEPLVPRKDSAQGQSWHKNVGGSEPRWNCGFHLVGQEAWEHGEQGCCSISLINLLLHSLSIPEILLWVSFNPASNATKWLG